MLSKCHQWKIRPRAFFVYLAKGRGISMFYCWLNSPTILSNIQKHWNHIKNMVSLVPYHTEKSCNQVPHLCACLCPFRCRLSGTGAACCCARACGHCWNRESSFPSALLFGRDWGPSWKAGGWLACFSRWAWWSRWIAWGVSCCCGLCQVWLDAAEIPELLSSESWLSVYSTGLQGTEVMKLEDTSCIKRLVPGGLGAIAESLQLAFTLHDTGFVLPCRWLLQCCLDVPAALWLLLKPWFDSSLWCAVGQQIHIAAGTPVFLQRFKGVLEKLSDSKLCHSLLWQFPGFEVSLVSGTAGQQAGEESSTGYIVIQVRRAADVRCCKCKCFERRFVGEEEALLWGELEGWYFDILAHRAGWGEGIRQTERKSS